MVKKLITIALGLTLAFGAMAQRSNNDGHKLPLARKSVTFSASDVQYWVGTGSNSAVVIIGWDDNPNGNFALVWGVHWNGSETAANMLDTIATYDERTTYTGISSGFMTGFYYNDGNLVSGSSASYWCYTINGGYAGAYGSQAMADGDVMEISSSCMFSLTTATVATDPNAGASCARAQSVSVANITTTSVDVTVNDTANVNNYTLRLFAGTTLVDSAVITSSTHTFSGLTANTAYKVTLVSNCSDGTQTNELNTTFRTPCVTIAHSDLPWTEDFQSGTGSSYSTSSAFFSNHVFCWDLINPYSTSDPYVNNSSTVNVSGGQCLYVSSRPASPTILVLPPFEDTPDQLRLQFDVLSSYGHGFEAGVITNPADDSTFVPIATCLPTGSGWNHFEVTFAGVTTGRLALRRNDAISCYLDNVTVDELPSCVKPSQIVVSDITASTATLTIADPNSTNHYMIYYTDEDSVEIYSNSYTLSNLLPNTRYVVRASTLCADSTTGFTEQAFRTGCGPIAIPYHEDFGQFVDVANGYGNAVTDSTLPCWGFVKGRALDRLELFPPSQGSSYGYGEDGYTMRIYGNYSDSRDIVVLPEFDQEINTLEMSLMARPSETGAFGGVLQIGYVTNATDSSTFVAVTNYPCTQFANGYDLCTSTFLNAPIDSRIAIRYLPTGGSAKSWYIDDIDVHDMPACVRAQGISVDSIGTDGFSLHVADPTTVNHYRYYLTAGDIVDSADFYDTVTRVTDLTASTDYQLQVVSICDDGTLTLPHTISVGTLCGPVTMLPFEEGFEDWIASQAQGMNRCWNRLYMNSSNRLVTNNYPYCATSSANAYEGFKSLKMYSKGTSSAVKEYSVTYLPEFEDSVNTLKVCFFYKYGGSTANINRVKIAVGVSDSVGDTSTFTRLATFSPAVVGWNEFEVELNGYTGTGRRITIMQTSTGTTAITSYIDNLVVDTIRSCNRPATLTVDSVSAYDATLSWTDPDEAGSYIVSWSNGSTNDSAIVTGATTYVLTGLVPSTNYTVGVRSICWGTPTNARLLSFTTSCAPMPLPWEMNFDNITNISQLSSCWNRYSGRYIDSTQSATLTSSSSGWTLSTTAFESSPHIKVNIYGTSCKYWIVTPEISLSENAELTFDYMLTDYNNANAPETVPDADDRFVVLATTDNGASWIPVAQWGSDTERDDYALASVPNTVSHANVSLSAFTGQTVCLAFYGESTVSGSDNDFRIDNMSVHAAASTPDTTPVTPIVLCNTVHTLPYTENFSGYTTDQSMRVYYASAPQPECWTVLGNGRFTANYDTTATANIWFGGIGNSTSTNNYGCVTVNDPYYGFIAYGHYDGTYATYIANEHDYGTMRYAILPPFDHPLSQTLLTFDHRTSARTGAALLVGYIVNDTSDFVAVDSIATDFRVLHHDTIRFAAHGATIPADARLTLLWKSTDTTHTGNAPANYYCGIDNIKVDYDTVGDTPEPPAPLPADATIAASDILFWVGEGGNEVVMAVNWADTALAWGYRFAMDTVTVQQMMDDIAAVDPRFSYSGSSYINDINYIDTAAGMTDTLGVTVGNYWWSLLNHEGGWGLSDVLHNGDFYKWGDLGVAIVTDSVDRGTYMAYTYVWPYAIQPVTVPDTTGDTPSPGPVVPEHGPFCGAVGTEGCNAIKADSSAFVAWATGVEVTRGPRNIANPDGPRATTGTESNVIGMATLDNVYEVVSLGDGGSALVTFAHPIRNGEGPDFAVFENSFGDVYLELAFVEVSSDGDRFVRFPATCLTQTETQLGNAGQTDPTNINNLAGKFRIGYGTPFDLEELRDSTGIDLDSIVYVRIVDVVGSINPLYGTYDAYGHIINDPWPTPFETGGFDLTGVGVIHERVDDTTQVARDATIDQSRIVFWTGNGTNQAVIAVNWASPDTCLAWGVKWNGTVTVKDLMDTIAAYDSRFSYFDNNGMLSDIVYSVDGLTLRLSASPSGNYWMYNVNGIQAQSMFNTLEVYNGDFIKWGDPNSGTSIGSDPWGYDILVWTTEVTPVSRPVNGINDIVTIVSELWPNPTTDYVNVSVSCAVKSILYDLSGRRVAVYSLNEGSNILDLSALQSGVYMLRTEGTVSKIVKR